MIENELDRRMTIRMTKEYDNKLSEIKNALDIRNRSELIRLLIDVLHTRIYGSKPMSDKEINTK